MIFLPGERRPIYGVTGTRSLDKMVHREERLWALMNELRRMRPHELHMVTASVSMRKPISSL